MHTYLYGNQWLMHNMCIYTYMCIHAYMHTHIHTYIHTYVCIYMHTYIHTYIYVHTRIHAYTYTYVHTYIHMHIHAYIYTYIHDAILIWLFLQCIPLCVWDHRAGHSVQLHMHAIQVRSSCMYERIYIHTYIHELYTKVFIHLELYASHTCDNSSKYKQRHAVRCVCAYRALILCAFSLLVGRACGPKASIFWSAWFPWLIRCVH
jgi:hypothetical protein